MRLNRVRAIAGAVFVLTLAVALLSPLERASHRTLTAHMVQHVLLIGIAAPAFALATPTALRPWPVRRWYWSATAAVALQTAVVTGWHAPFAFDAAIKANALHALEHLTMVGSTVLFWRVLARSSPLRGESVVAVFVSTLPPTILGLGMLLSTTPWYEAYPDVADQQVAGAVMWGVGGGIAVVEAVALFVTWLVTTERFSPAVA